MRLRKLLSVAGLALPALAAAYSAWWWQAASAVERGTLAWIEARRAEGALVEHRGLTVDGYPFRLRATLEAPHLATRGVEWTATRLLAEAPPWNHTRIDLDLPGEQRLLLVPAGQPPLELTARGGGRGSLRLTLAGQPVELRLGFADLTARSDGPPVPVAALNVAASQPAEPPAAHTDTGLTLALAASGVSLPEGALPADSGGGQPLGRLVRSAQLSARVLGPPPRPEPASLSAWSRDGGTVELERLTLDWGPLKLAMSGTLALDRQLQPQAALTAELRGAQAVLGVLQGRLRPAELTLARTMLAMLARPVEPGGEPVLTAPLTVQDRSLYLGPLKIAALPPVTW